MYQSARTYRRNSRTAVHCCQSNSPANGKESGGSILEIGVPSIEMKFHPKSSSTISDRQFCINAGVRYRTAEGDNSESSHASPDGNSELHDCSDALTAVHSPQEHSDVKTSGRGASANASATKAKISSDVIGSFVRTKCWLTTDQSLVHEIRENDYAASSCGINSVVPRGGLTACGWAPEAQDASSSAC